VCAFIHTILDDPNQAIEKIFKAGKEGDEFWSACSEYKKDVRKFLLGLVEETSDVSPCSLKRLKYNEVGMSGREANYANFQNLKDSKSNHPGNKFRYTDEEARKIYNMRAARIPWR
jgi:hypothetical protein